MGFLRSRFRVLRRLNWLLTVCSIVLFKFSDISESSDLSNRRERPWCPRLREWNADVLAARVGSMLQYATGLFTLLYGHTHDLPTVIAERRARVRSPLAIEFQEMRR